MGRAGRWSIAGLCIAAVGLAYLGDGVLDASGAAKVRRHQPESVRDNCTALLLDRASGLTTAARCPDRSSIHLEAARRETGGVGKPPPIHDRRRRQNLNEMPARTV
jgi:hypothetical protein